MFGELLYAFPAISLARIGSRQCSRDDRCLYPQQQDYVPHVCDFGSTTNTLTP